LNSRANRFLCRDFLAFDEEYYVIDFRLRVWEVEVAEVERSSHHLTAIDDDGPAMGADDLV